MRNLKKVLALAVASVMLMGMMVVGTSAAYSDVADTDNVEAIEVLKMVGVMAGDDKGNFNPGKAVTRNEMAVVMSNLLGLDVKDYAGSTPFTDVPAWAEPYVAACYANGIVSGTSATTFGGEGTVTTAQAGLMVMKALGYFQYSSDFGDDWMLSTVKQASKIDLFDGVATKANANLTRNDVAQLVLNALEAGIVEPTGTPGTIIEGNGLTITTGSSVSYGYTTDPATALYTDLYDGELTKGTSTDDMGRPATLWTYAKAGQETKTVKAADVADVIYIITDADYNTLNEIVTEDELTVDSDARMYNANSAWAGYYSSSKNVELKYGTVVEVFKGADKEVEKFVYYNFDVVEITDVEAYDEEDTMVKDYEASVLYTVKNLRDGAVDSKYYVDNLKEACAGYQEIGTFAKGDILTIVKKDDGTFLEIAETKTVEGKKTASGTGYIKVDGTKYTVEYTNLSPATTVAVAGNYTDTWTYYLDPAGTIIDGELKEAAETALEYVYVISDDAQNEDTALLGTNKNKAVVKVMYLDGTKETVEYALTKVTATAGVTGQKLDSAGTAYEAGQIAKDKYYYTYMGTKYEYEATLFQSTVGTGFAAYTKNEAGQITLKTAAKAEVSAIHTNLTARKDTQLMWTAVSPSTDKLYATNKTVVTVLDKDGVAKTFTGYKNFLADDATGEIENVTALVIYGAKETEAAKVYYYETNSAGYSVDGDKIEAAMYVSTGDTVDGGVVATFYVKGEKVTYTVTNDITALVAGQLVELTKDDDGNVSAGTLTEGTDYVATTVDVVSDDYVVVGGVVVDLTADCETYLVNAENKVMGKTELVAHDSRLAAIFVNSDGVYMVIIYKDMPAEVQ